MSIKCKDIITNMKYLSQNVMKSVDLIKLSVAIDSSTVHLYFVARQRTGPGRAVPGAARSLARRQGRLLTPRRRGAPSVVGPADGPGCCAPDAAPGMARPGPVRCRTTKYKWTVDESIATINLIKSTDFMTF